MISVQLRDKMSLDEFPFKSKSQLLENFNNKENAKRPTRIERDCSLQLQNTEGTLG